MCNSEDLDVSFAISLILCIQREKEDRRFAPKLQRMLSRFVTAKEVHDFQYSRTKPQGPYAGVLSSSLQQEPSLRNRLKVQGTCVIVDLHDV